MHTFTLQLCIICKITEGVLNSLIQIISNAKGNSILGLHGCVMLLAWLFLSGQQLWILFFNSLKRLTSWTELPYNCVASCLGKSSASFEPWSQCHICGYLQIYPLHFHLCVQWLHMLVALLTFWIDYSNFFSGQVHIDPMDLLLSGKVGSIDSAVSSECVHKCRKS